MQIKTKIVSCHTADSKPVKQEVNGTVILPPLVFPGNGHLFALVVVDALPAVGRQVESGGAVTLVTSAGVSAPAALAVTLAAFVDVDATY